MSERHVFRAVIPLAPSVNDSLRPAELRIRNKSGKPVRAIRLVKTREAEAFEKECRAVVAPLVANRALWSGVLEFYLTVYVPSLSSDGGNRVKLTEDAIRHLVIRDDQQIVEWHIVKRVDAKRPRAELVVQHANPAEHAELARRLAVAEARAEKRPSRRVGAGRTASLPPAVAARLRPNTRGR